VKDPGGTDSIMLKHKIRHLTSVHSIRDPRIFHKGFKRPAGLGHDVALISCHERAEVVDGIRIVPIDPPRHRFDRMVRVGCIERLRGNGRTSTGERSRQR
jgi:hypothetical protein